MADANARVGIVINAEDKTSPAFKSASKGADRLSKVFSKMGNGLKAMPEQAGKAAGALLLFQNSASQLGAGVADVVNKISAVVGLMATGGPLGIAIGAITLLVAAGAAVWSAYKDRLDATARSMAGVEAAGRSLNGSLMDQAGRVAALESELANQGLSRHEQEVAAIKAKQTILEGNIPILRRELTELDRRNKTLVANGVITQELADEQFRMDQIVLANAEAKIPLLARELEAIEMLEFARRDGEAGEAARAESDKARADSAADRARKLGAIESEIARQTLEMDRKREAELVAFHNNREARRQAEFNNNVKRVNEQKAAERRANQLTEDEEKRLSDFKVDMAERAGQAAMSVLQGVTAIHQAEGEKAKKRALANMLTVLNAQIISAAVAAAAFAFSGYQNIPWLGPVIGAAAAIVAFGTGMGFRKLITGSAFAQGGVATGGVPGKDSIPAMLRPGERVLTPEQQRDGAGSGGGAPQVTINMRSLKPGVTEGRMMAKVISRELKSAMRLGITGGVPA